jgi:dipeptidyl aminopeptidase/acylaminoacyl peptidase
MPRKGVEIEDLRGFVFVSDPQASPDGGKVAFVHTAIDYDGNDYVKHIWMADAETGEAAQFTGGQGKDSNPRWSPDGSRLLFLSSNREPDKKNQLLVISAGGGEAVAVADLENGVMNPEWSPDSKRILFTSRVWEPEKPETDGWWSNESTSSSTLWACSPVNESTSSLCGPGRSPSRSPEGS